MHSTMKGAAKITEQLSQSNENSDQNRKEHNTQRQDWERP
jgi:hypothetical protein